MSNQGKNKHLYDYHGRILHENFFNTGTFKNFFEYHYWLHLKASGSPITQNYITIEHSHGETSE
jgi:hypothetical protein